MLKKMSCKVTLVSNGQEAVNAVAEKPFNFVIMDCQMPVMDGYQATAAIRQREKKEGLDHHIPIIALTANALEGDREKCLSAGMDDYVSKPFNQADISNILARWSREKLSVGVTKPQEEVSIKGIEVGSSSVDKSALNAIRDLQMEGEPDILEKIIHVYLSSSESIITKLRGALVVNDLEALRNSAHSLKSSSANLGATKLSGICSKLELDCRKNMLENAPDQVSAIEAEFLQVEVVLNREISI